MDSDSRSRPEEDWGCVSQDELFFTAGPTPSLQLLLEQFEKTRHGAGEMPSISNVTTELMGVMGSEAPRWENNFIVRKIFHHIHIEEKESHWWSNMKFKRKRTWRKC
jgi:hypothetical protein